MGYIAPALSDGVVTFFDVLGWRGVYNRLTDPTVKLSILLDGLRKQGVRQRGKEGLDRDVVVKSISDTVAMFTQCEVAEAPAAINVHGELAKWTILHSIEAEIPIRGAISFGQFAIQDNIFIGKAVDEAAAWHEHANWVGVHLTPSAEYVFEKASQSGLWVNYSPPNKTALNWKPHCVNWTQGWTDRESEVRKIKAKFRSLGPIVPEVAVKLTNTLNFIEATSKPRRRRWFNIFE